MCSHLKGDLESGAFTEIDQMFTTSINEVDVLDKNTTKSDATIVLLDDVDDKNTLNIEGYIQFIL